MPRRFLRDGFTLVELVITIAIVIILSVISVPIYRGYVDKAKMSEGYALLGLIKSAQENYYSEYGIFLDDDSSTGGNERFTCNEEILGINTRTNKYYTAFNVNKANNVAPNPLLREGFLAIIQGNDMKSLTMRYSRIDGVTVY